MGNLEFEGASLEWLKNAGVKIKADKVIYIDPYQLADDSEKADIIFITHDHDDHCSSEDVKKISRDNTVVVATQACLNKLGIEGKAVEPNEKIEVEGIKVETVPSYNVKKDFHPQAKRNVGYVIEINGKRIYHAGDTDLIPEMNMLDNIYIALLPIGGTYTMDAMEGAQAANIIQAEISVPIHYGSVAGSPEDAEVFRKNCEVDVQVLE